MRCDPGEGRELSSLSKQTAIGLRKSKDLVLEVLEDVR